MKLLLLEWYQVKGMHVNQACSICSDWLLTKRLDSSAEGGLQSALSLSQC